MCTCIKYLFEWMLCVYKCACKTGRWKKLQSLTNITLTCSLPLGMWACCLWDPLWLINCEKEKKTLKWKAEIIDVSWVIPCGDPVSAWSLFEGFILWEAWKCSADLMTILSIRCLIISYFQCDNGASLIVVLKESLQVNKNTLIDLLNIPLYISA